MIRHGEVIRVKPEKLAEYKYHHAHAWAEVDAMIKECNIRNYSIFSKVNICLHIMNMSGRIMRQTWPKWHPILKHRNGGI